MKKLFLGLALTAGTLAFAQETTETKTVNASPLKNDVKPVRFGIKAGETLPISVSRSLV